LHFNRQIVRRFRHGNEVRFELMRADLTRPA
jgi:hypothetical protein